MNCCLADLLFLLQQVHQSQAGWPASALESSASGQQPDEGPASLGERQQQQSWQAFAHLVNRAPDPGGVSPARAGQQDARWRSSPGQAPQQPLEAVPEGEPCLLEPQSQIKASLHLD